MIYIVIAWSTVAEFYEPEIITNKLWCIPQFLKPQYIYTYLHFPLQNMTWFSDALLYWYIQLQLTTGQLSAKTLTS